VAGLVSLNPLSNKQSWLMASILLAKYALHVPWVIGRKYGKLAVGTLSVMVTEYPPGRPKVDARTAPEGLEEELISQIFY
jgi:hypothetical protein